MGGDYIESFFLWGRRGSRRPRARDFDFLTARFAEFLPVFALDWFSEAPENLG